MSIADRALPSATRLLLGRELRVHLRTLLYWVVPVAALIVLVVSLQPSMAGDGGVLAAKLAAMPDGIRQAFGLTLVDLDRPAAYLATNFIYVTLTAGLFAASLGATVIAKEDALRTAELLYTMPVERGRVLLGKTLATAIHVLAFNAVLAVVALVALGGLIDAPLEPGLVASLFVGTAALGLCFAGVGLLVATLVDQPRGAGQVALGVTLGSYLLSVLGAASPKIGWIAALSPFGHVEPARIVLAGGVDPAAVAALVALGGLGAALAIGRYRRRDLLA